MCFKSLDVLLNSNKIIPHYNVRIKNSHAISSPISAEIHWTSNCNYDCVHCSYGSRRKTTNYLKKQVIENLINDLIIMECQGVYLSGGGEPTVVKKWGVYSDQLISNGVEVALITNGIAVQERHINTIRKMNYIAISVYSTKEERYNKITESRFFDKQFSLPKIIKNNKSAVVVGARCVINKINYDELYDIYCAAMEAGFDYIIFIPAVDYEGRGIVLEKSWVDLVKIDIKKNFDKFDHDRTNVKSLLNKSVSHYSTSTYLDDIKNSKNECNAIKIGSGVFFNYDAGVYLCQPDIGNKELEIGNLNNDRFPDIWNSDRHHKVIAKLNKRWSNGGCKNCRSIAFNSAIDSHNSAPVDINSIEMDCFL
jgi:radical SAM protein with 4Fe4S-binding SPASM domain